MPAARSCEAKPATQHASFPCGLAALQPAACSPHRAPTPHHHIIFSSLPDIHLLLHHLRTPLRLASIQPAQAPSLSHTTSQPPSPSSTPTQSPKRVAVASGYVPSLLAPDHQSSRDTPYSPPDRLVTAASSIPSHPSRPIHTSAFPPYHERPALVASCGIGTFICATPSIPFPSLDSRLNLPTRTVLSPAPRLCV